MQALALQFDEQLKGKPDFCLLFCCSLYGESRGSDDVRLKIGDFRSQIEMLRPLKSGSPIFNREPFYFKKTSITGTITSGCRTGRERMSVSCFFSSLGP